MKKKLVEILILVFVRREQREVDQQRVDCDDLEGLRRRRQHVGAAVPRSETTRRIQSRILRVHFVARIQRKGTIDKQWPSFPPLNVLDLKTNFNVLSFQSFRNA